MNTVYIIKYDNGGFMESFKSWQSEYFFESEESAYDYLNDSGFEGYHKGLEKYYKDDYSNTTYADIVEFKLFEAFSKKYNRGEL